MGHENEDTRECEAMRKIFVGGLNKSTTEEAFLSYFSQFGNTVDSVIIRDPHSKDSRGFGFITYDASDAVEKVFGSRPHELDGKTVDCKRAMPKDSNTNSAHAKVTKLFIGGVKPEITEEKLKAYFEERHSSSCGNISKIELVPGKHFGFIECSDPDFADRLTISETSFTIEGKTMNLQKSDSQGRGGGGNRGGNFRGRGGMNRGNRGGGFNRGGGGGFRGRGGNNNRGGYSNGGGYNNGSYNQNNGGYDQSSYSQNYQQGGYNQGYDNQQYGQQSYNQGGYSNFDQSYGNYNQQGYQGNQQSSNRYTPY